MSEQENGQVSTVQRPTTDNREDWKVYWKAQGWPWRTEPEIDAGRQKYLAERRAIIPDIEKGIYPFKDIEPKLARADIEWLLATHENGRGPIEWKDKTQRARTGLDLRGANLSQENLKALPLANMLGGLTFEESFNATEKQINMAAIWMEDTDLGGVQLQGAWLHRSRLQKAYLRGARLQSAYLWGAELQDTDLGGVRFKNADLREAQLQGAYLARTQLQGAFLVEAQLQGAWLRGTKFEDANLEQVTLSDQKYGSARLEDIKWGNANLAVIDWQQVKILGDEKLAHQSKNHRGETKDKTMWIEGYQEAVRANRQLSVALQSQGINEDAARFAYRAQVLQKHVFWLHLTKPRTRLRQKAHDMGAWLFSWFLFLLAGYGYKPWRSFGAYLIVIVTFAITYFIIGHTVGPTLSPLGAFVFSMTSFHGRGFFPGGISLDDPLTVVAAFEAFVGLLIEVTFIATLTQRLFGK